MKSSGIISFNTFSAILGISTVTAIIAFVLWLTGTVGVYVGGSPSDVQSFIQTVTPVGAILLHALPFAFTVYYCFCIWQMEWITKPAYYVIAAIVFGLYIASNVSTGVAKEAVSSLTKSYASAPAADPKGFWGK